MSGKEGPIQIDVNAVLHEKLGKRASRVPAWLVRRIEKLIRQDGLNELLRHAWPRRGADFCEAVLGRLDVRLDVVHPERLPAGRRIVIASNHPLGGIDGMALIRYFASVYGDDLHFVVNDMLRAVEPLNDVFLPINKHGAQSREAIAAIDAAFAGDAPVLVFPAGLCSRRRGGRVEDLEWHKMFVAKARQYHRDIVPVHFIGRNSPRFYRFASLRERLGIKLNIEMTLLPSEIFRGAGSTYRLVCGQPIPWQSLGADARSEAARIRKIVNDL